MSNSQQKHVYYAVGQCHDELVMHPSGQQELRRWRLPFTRRHWFQWRGMHNHKSLQYERRLVDKKPLWWMLALGLLTLTIPLLPNSMVTAAMVFCIYSAINVFWTLIIGTAGIFSLATLAVVGLAGYGAAAANVYLGVPWPLMFLVGGVLGLIIGFLLALPSTRLDGLYYALLTLGFAEICRNVITQLRPLTPTNGSINNVASFVPDDWYLQRPGLLLNFFAALGLLLLALLVFRLVNSEKLGMQLQTAREDEEYAEAIGIDFRRSRMWVFIIASAGLGVIGAFYSMVYRSISPSIFSLDQLLLMFSMLVIGGIGRSEGAVVGTAVVTVIDKGLIFLGPIRILLIAAVMLTASLWTNNGLAGIKQQFTHFRERKQSEARAKRTEKGGEVMPEEAIDFTDKQDIYYRRFDKRLREKLKTLVTPEVIKEHQLKPLGQHSDALSRLLNYFRRGNMADKYAILRLTENFHSYRVVAFSGRRGAPPRVVNDVTYNDINEAYHAVFLLRISDLINS